MTYNNYNHDDYIKQHKHIQLPPFNVGDWVVRTCNNQVDKQGLPRKVLVDSGFLTNKLVQATLDTYQLWIPQPGEWCWFFGGAMKVPDLRKFIAYSCRDTYFVEGAGETEYFSHCEPFIGNLPKRCK